MAIAGIASVTPEQSRIPALMRRKLTATICPSATVVTSAVNHAQTTFNHLTQPIT